MLHPSFFFSFSGSFTRGHFSPRVEVVGSMRDRLLTGRSRRSISLESSTILEDSSQAMNSTKVEENKTPLIRTTSDSVIPENTITEENESLGHRISDSALSSRTRNRSRWGRICFFI